MKTHSWKLRAQSDGAVVSRQLHSSGVLDALRVARSGFPDRVLFAEFANYFGHLAGVSRAARQQAPRESCLTILAKLAVDADHFKVGRERIFLSQVPGV